MSNQSIFTSIKIPKSDLVSKVKRNREYLISETIASDLNTYNNFGIFKSYNDLYKTEYDSTGMEVTDGTGPGTPAVRSIFNRAGGMPIGTDMSDPNNMSEEKDVRNTASSWRISNNVPLMDSPENRQRIRQHSGCSVKELVQQSERGLLGRALYSYADFMYCKYLGKISNNYLITLRRFPVPPGDFITTIGTGGERLAEGKNRNVQPIGCMVTWLGAPGNDMSNILKYTYKMPYQDKQAKWEEVSSDADSQTGVLNSIAAAFDPAYRRAYTSGHGGAAFNAYIGKWFKQENGPYPARGHVDGNKIYGPIDKVKKTMMRGEEGLDFDQEITLTFDYELRSYNGINTRQAMLDLLANILQVTFTTGGFWGGGYRGGGMHQNSIFNNLEIFKCSGGFTDFVDAFNKDVSNVWESTKATIKANGGLLQTIISLANSIGGMLCGGALNKLGRPARAYADSLLSERPVGLWHIMVGNPNHPIISIGNMVLTNTEVQHYGPLGLDDFPTGLKVICTLKRGKPRDLREIEKMYMNGNDRIYFSMGPKVLDMYKQAANYKSSSNTSKNDTANSKTQEEIPTTSGGVTASNSISSNSTTEVPAEESDYKHFQNIAMKDITENDLYNMDKILHKWFGENDTYSIYFPAAEQEYGAGRPKNKKSNSGSKDNSK